MEMVQGESIRKTQERQARKRGGAGQTREGSGVGAEERRRGGEGLGRTCSVAAYGASASGSLLLALAAQLERFAEMRLQTVDEFKREMVEELEDPEKQRYVSAHRRCRSGR